MISYWLILFIITSTTVLIWSKTMSSISFLIFPSKSWGRFRTRLIKKSINSGCLLNFENNFNVSSSRLSSLLAFSSNKLVFLSNWESRSCDGDGEDCQKSVWRWIRLDGTYRQVGGFLLSYTPSSPWIRNLLKSEQLLVRKKVNFTAIN